MFGNDTRLHSRGMKVHRRSQRRAREWWWICAVVFLATSGPLLRSQISPAGTSALQGGDDCSDPLMAATAQCIGAVGSQYSPLAISPPASVLGGQYGLPTTNPAAPYSDVEPLNQQSASSASSAHSGNHRPDTSRFWRGSVSPRPLDLCSS
jgi:hypothetical protein